MNLTLQLKELWVEDLNRRVLLFVDVVGKDWVIKEEIERVITIDAVLLGLSLPELLSRWLEGIYKNLLLDLYKISLMKGIDWLLTGDEEHLREISKKRIKEIEELLIEEQRRYLEELIN